MTAAAQIERVFREEHALDQTGIQQIQVKHRPRLLSDNGPAFIADALKDYLKPHEFDHIHGCPLYPQTQSKIERYHRSMKSVVKLNTFFFPWELEHALADFVVCLTPSSITNRSTT